MLKHPYNTTTMISSSPTASTPSSRRPRRKRRRRLEFFFLFTIGGFSIVSLTCGPSFCTTSIPTAVWILGLSTNTTKNDDTAQSSSSTKSAKEVLLQGYLAISKQSERAQAKKRQLVRHRVNDLMEAQTNHSFNNTIQKRFRLRQNLSKSAEALDKLMPFLLRHKKDPTTTEPNVTVISQFPRPYSYDNVPCRYHGNCPVGTICGDNGMCEYYLPFKDNDGTTFSSMDKLRSADPTLYACANACHQELALDEWYQDESNITIHSIEPAKHPHQCLLTFSRFPGHWANVPSVERWMQRRFRHVVRVDPQQLIRQPNSTTYNKRADEEESDNKWYALCNQPCKTDKDCTGATCHGRPKSSIPPGIFASPKTCQTKPVSTEDDLVLVSGAGKTYFHGLKNLVASALYWAPNLTIVVYNLGMDPDQVKTIQEEWAHPKLVLEWPEGIPGHYPDHVRKRLTNYAWKPIIVNETVHKYKSILWHDAGSTFVGPLDPVRDILHRHGAFLVHGQDDHMNKRAHPDMFRFFGQNKSTMPTGPHFGGSVHGFVWPSRYIDTIVIPNAECAMIKDCISPQTSTIANHRYDQTGLSILAYHKYIHAPHYTEYLAAHPEQVPTSSKKQKQLPTRFISYTSRQSNYFYSQFYGWNSKPMQEVRQDKQEMAAL